MAEEIVAAGGAAVADGSDVVDARRAARRSSTRRSSGSGASTSWSTTPGSCGGPAFPEVDADNLERHLAVHVGGSFNTTRAAWPHMVEQGYGRIVMTTSTGMFGLPNNLAYATAKGGVVGLTRSLSDRRAPSTASRSTSSPRRP